MKKEKQEEFIRLLKENSRTTLTKISRLTGVPITELFDELKALEKEYKFTIIKKGDEK